MRILVGICLGFLGCGKGTLESVAQPGTTPGATGDVGAKKVESSVHEEAVERVRSPRAKERAGNIPELLLERQLTPDEIAEVCRVVQDRTTIEAGATVASLWLSGSERISIDDIRLLGKATRMKCIRAYCMETLISLERGIRVHDVDGTFEGMKAAIGSLSLQAKRELFPYIDQVNKFEMADVMLDLYRRAERIAQVDRAPLELTSEQMETIGQYAWTYFVRST